MPAGTSISATRTTGSSCFGTRRWRTQTGDLRRRKAPRYKEGDCMRTSLFRYVALAMSASLILVACGGGDTDNGVEEATDEQTQDADDAGSDADDAGSEADDAGSDDEAGEQDLSGEPPVALNFGHGFTPTHEISAELIEPFIEQVA